jgi:hypothetical protein
MQQVECSQPNESNSQPQDDTFEEREDCIDRHKAKRPSLPLEQVFCLNLSENGGS